MKYMAMDGYEMEASNYQELAKRMWESMFDPDDTIEEWMKNSARRAFIYNNSIIRTDSVEHHMEDLIAAGFISPAPEGK